MNDSSAFRDQSAHDPKLECSVCGNTDVDSWEKVKKTLFCTQCRSSYKLIGGERLVRCSQAPQSRSLFQWSGMKSDHRWLAACVALILVAGLAVVLWSLSGSSRKQQPNLAAGLPVDLTARAQLFSRAWIAGDGPQLLRLSDPGSDRNMRKWYAQNPPPRDKGLSINVAVQHQDNHKGQVAVSGPGDASANVVLQQWISRNGTWYFVPTLDQTR